MMVKWTKRNLPKKVIFPWWWIRDRQDETSPTDRFTDPPQTIKIINLGFIFPKFGGLKPPPGTQLLTVCCLNHSWKIKECRILNASSPNSQTNIGNQVTIPVPCRPAMGLLGWNVQPRVVFGTLRKTEQRLCPWRPGPEIQKNKPPFPIIFAEASVLNSRECKSHCNPYKLRIDFFAKEKLNASVTSR